MVLTEMYMGKAEGVHSFESSRNEDVMASKIIGNIMGGNGASQMMGSGSFNGKGFASMLGGHGNLGGNGFSDMLGQKPSKQGGFKQMIQMPTHKPQTNFSSLMQGYGFNQKVQKPQVMNPNFVNNMMSMNQKVQKPQAINPNFVNNMMGLNQKVNPYVAKDLFGNAQRRMKMQNNLPMFGDYDKDKVPNIFDCDPFDPKKQAFIHDLVGGLKSAGGSVVGKVKQAGGAVVGLVDKSIEGGVTPIESGSVNKYQEGELKSDVIIPKGVQVIDSQGNTISPQSNPNFAQRFGSTILSGTKQGFGSLASNIGELAKRKKAELEDAQALRSQFKQTAIEQVSKEIQAGKLRKTYQADLERELLKSQGLRRDPVTGQLVKTGPLGASFGEGISGLKAAGSAFGSGQGISEGLGTSTQPSYGTGISGALGLSSPPGYVGQQSYYPTQSAPQQAISQQVQAVQARPVGPGTIPASARISPFSGRLVSYTRGPYKKRRKVIQE